MTTLENIILTVSISDNSAPYWPSELDDWAAMELEAQMEEYFDLCVDPLDSIKATLCAPLNDKEKLEIISKIVAVFTD